MNKILIKLSILLLAITQAFSQQTATDVLGFGFNKNKDLLLAQFDCRPDTDDVHAQAALGSLLTKPAWANINVYAVLGAYGKQDGNFINSSDLMTLIYGPEGSNTWTFAHREGRGGQNRYNRSVTRIKNKAKAVLNNGGRVWVQEAGQSDITKSWLEALAADGVSSRTIKNNVIVVQHSPWNRRQASAGVLDYVEANATLIDIDDGNEPMGPDNNTPKYKSDSKDFRDDAIASSNPNALARAYWLEADRLIEEIRNNPNVPLRNGSIRKGGVDFSDVVESWWILDLGTAANTTQKFWNKFIVNSDAIQPGDSDLDVAIPAVSFDNESDPGNRRRIRIADGVVKFIKNNTWISFNSFDFENGIQSIRLVSSSPKNNVRVEFRTRSETGPLIGTVGVANTGSFATFTTNTLNQLNLSPTGVRDLYLVFKGGRRTLMDLQEFTITSN